MSESVTDRRMVFPDGVRDPEVTGSPRATFASGVLLYIVAMIGSVAVTMTVGGPVGFLIGFPIGMVFAYLSTGMLRRSKQQRAVGALALLERDPRPPVVYFRSFTHDATTAKGVNSTSWVTEEEQLGAVLNRIGPTVAIGEPGENLPDVGAARFYVPDEQWKDAVGVLLPRAALLVLRLGYTESFWWEVNQAVGRAAPERVVLLVPRDEALYEQFRARFATMTPHPLPVLDGWRRRARWRGSLMAVISFDPAWRPTAALIQTYPVPFWRRSPAYPLGPVLTMAMEDVHRQIGVPWQRPGINSRLALVLASLVVGAFCMAYALSIWV